MPYRTYQPGIAPAWLQRPVGNAWLAAHGDAKDATVDRAKAAVKARFARTAPPDALSALGAERGIERGLTETDHAYANRVAAAWDSWAECGTANGLLTALAAVGYSPVIATVNGTLYWLDGGLNYLTLPAGCWAVDSTPAFWSKFIVLFVGPQHQWAIDASHSYTPTPFGICNAGGQPDGTCPELTITVVSAGSVKAASVQIRVQGTGINTVFGVPKSGIIETLFHGVVLTLSGTISASGSMVYTPGTFPASTSETVLQIKRTIRAWAPAHATCAGIVVHTAGELYGYPGYAETYATRACYGAAADSNRVIWTM